MLTPELVKDAITTAHNMCNRPEGCTHADALEGAKNEYFEDLTSTILIGAAKYGPRDGQNIMGLIYNHALHVGYRLRQLEEMTDKSATPEATTIQ